MKLFFAALIISALVASARAESWRGIVPLRSTRADVERLLGAPDPANKNLYQTTNETIAITYADVPCAHGWQVPLETVISVMVHPKNGPKFVDLKVDETKFEKRRDLNDASLYYYVNQALGLNYTVSAGVVTNIEYFPSAKDSRRRCPRARTTKPRPRI